MHIEIPDDLTVRLQHLAQDTGQDVHALVCDAIEARLALQKHVTENLEGWTQETLRAAIQEGLESGPGRPFDYSVVVEIKTRGRKRLATQQRDAT